MNPQTPPVRSGLLNTLMSASIRAMLLAAAVPSGAAAHAVVDGRPSVTWERTTDKDANGQHATVFGLIHIFGNAVHATPEAHRSKCSDGAWRERSFPPAGVWCRQSVWAWVAMGEACPTPPDDLTWTQGRIHTYGTDITPRDARTGRTAPFAAGHVLSAGKRSCWTARESSGAETSPWAPFVWFDVDEDGRIVATSGKNPDPGPERHVLPLVMSVEAGPALQGFVRIINHSNEAGTVRIEAVDDAGVRFGPVTLDVGAWRTVHFNSNDLEEGNPDKGLSGGVGDGEGNWRVELTTTLDIEPNAYMRTSDGFLTSMHDWVVEGGPRRYHVPFFNPASNSKRSLLRITNMADARATVEIDGRDDSGEPAESGARLTLGPRRTVTLTARTLEEGTGWLDGRFGDGAGKWHLYVSADQPIQIMNLLRSPTGHIANLSTTTKVADRMLVREPSACGDSSAVVSIPDAGLRGAIEEALGKTVGAAITQGELAGLTVLYADSREIQSLAGLECAIGLSNLDLTANRISDLTPLAGLTALEVLVLDGNPISDLSPLSGLTGLSKLLLQTLTLQPLPISDLSPLSGLTGLTVLWVDGKISDLSPLSGLTALTELALQGSQISDLSPLSGLTGLSKLYLFGNQISDLSPLSGLSALSTLSLSVNQISDLAPLSGLAALSDLALYGNQISDISPLSGLSVLSTLNLSVNQISDLTPLSGLTALSYLRLRGNQISDITPLSGLTALSRLELPNNQISDISPLVRNSGLGAGDRLLLVANPLNAISRYTHIPALRARGVDVTFPTQGMQGWISAGGGHTCGVRDSGTVACWGLNDYGESTPPAGKFISVSAGVDHSCGVRDTGTVACWGWDGSGQHPPPAGKFLSVSAGSFHTCGVRDSGAVACWGQNYSGQSTPPAGKFISVSAGEGNTCGVRDTGTVACWGWDGFGESTPPAGTFVSVSAGGAHTCGVRDSGSVACWGYGGWGQSTPPAGSFVSVSAGGNYTCGVRDSGTVACWGLNDYGESTPPAGKFISVSAGWWHTCGILESGSVVCWGDNDDGQSTPPAGRFLP